MRNAAIFCKKKLATCQKGSVLKAHVAIFLYTLRFGEEVPLLKNRKQPGFENSPGSGRGGNFFYSLLTHPIEGPSFLRRHRLAGLSLWLEEGIPMHKGEGKKEKGMHTYIGFLVGAPQIPPFFNLLLLVWGLRDIGCVGIPLIETEVRRPSVWERVALLFCQGPRGYRMEGGIRALIGLALSPDVRRKQDSQKIPSPTPFCRISPSSPAGCVRSSSVNK